MIKTRLQYLRGAETIQDEIEEYPSFEALQCNWLLRISQMFALFGNFAVSVIGPGGAADIQVRTDTEARTVCAEVLITTLSGEQDRKRLSLSETIEFLAVLVRTADPDNFATICIYDDLVDLSSKSVLAYDPAAQGAPEGGAI